MARLVTSGGEKRASTSVRVRRLVLLLLGVSCSPMVLYGQSAESRPSRPTRENDAARHRALAAEGSNRVNQVLPKPKLLLPDGFTIRGLAAELVKHPEEHRWFLRFDKDSQNAAPGPHPRSTLSSSVEPVANGDRRVDQADPLDVPIEILPCRQLAILTRIGSSQNKRKFLFQVNAEVTTYRNRNFVLPQSVHALSLFGRQPQTQTEAPAGTFPDQRNRDSDDSTPASYPASPRDPNDPRKGTLRETLLQIPRPLPLERLKAAEGSNAAAAGAKKTYVMGVTPRSDLLENSMVIDRIGRLAYNPEAGSWLFDFESDGVGLSEPPVALHPNRLLQKMEELTERETQGLKFRVSGEIFKYQNVNYMLLRKMFVVTDGGNLAK